MSDRTMEQGVRLSEQETDGVLMAAVAKGDREALEALYNRHAEAVERFLIGAGVSIETAETLLRRTFHAVWLNARRFPRNKRFPVFVFPLAHSFLVEEMARQGVGRGGSVSAEETGRPAAADSAERPSASPGPEENAAAALRALDGLGPEDRRVFALSEICRLSYQEIAEILGQTRSAVARRKAAAVSAVIAAMSPGGGDRVPETDGAAGAADAQKSAVTAYADGELSADESAPIEKTLDAGGPESVWHAEILRLREAIRLAAPFRLTPAPFEQIDEALELEVRRRRAFRLRLGFELACLAAAACLAVGGWVAGNPARLDKARTWLRRLGVVRTLPTLPTYREGSAAAWLLLPRGEGRLTVEGGTAPYRLPEAAALLSGDVVEIEEGAGPAHLVLADGSQILARGGSRFRFAISGSSPQIRIDRGDLWCSFVPQERIAIDSANGPFGSLGGEFNVRVGPASRVKIQKAETRDEALLPDAQGGGPAGRSARESKARQAPAEPLGTRITVVSGGVAAKKGQAALSGETLAIVEGGKTLVVDTRRNDPALEWSHDARQTPAYCAVAQFTYARRRLETAMNSANNDLLREAVKSLMAFWPGRTPEEVPGLDGGGAWRQQFADVAALRIESLRPIGQSVILRLRLQRDPPVRTRLLMEKGAEQWEPTRLLGFPIPGPAQPPAASQPGGNAEPKPDLDPGDRVG